MKPIGRWSPASSTMARRIRNSAREDRSPSPSPSKPWPWPSTSGAASCSPARSPGAARRRLRSSLDCCPPASRIRASAATGSSRSALGLAPPRETAERFTPSRSTRMDESSRREITPSTVRRASPSRGSPRPATSTGRSRTTARSTWIHLGRRRRSNGSGPTIEEGSCSPGRPRASRSGTWLWAGSRATASRTRAFGGDGVIRTDVDAYQDFANDALIDGRGRLLVGGGTDDGTEGDVGLLLRYLS